MPKLRIDDKIILRLKEDLYVQLTREEALPVVKSLLGLYEDKLNSCKGQISKIMSSMREMENLLTSYQNLIWIPFLLSNCIGNNWAIFKYYLFFATIFQGLGNPQYQLPFGKTRSEGGREKEKLRRWVDWARAAVFSLLVLCSDY